MNTSLPFYRRKPPPSRQVFGVTPNCQELSFEADQTLVAGADPFLPLSTAGVHNGVHLVDAAADAEVDADFFLHADVGEGGYQPRYPPRCTTSLRGSKRCGSWSSCANS